MASYILYLPILVIFAIFILAAALSIVRSIISAHRRKREEKALRNRILTYVNEERDNLIEQYYPEYMYSYSDRFSEKMGSSCQKYSFCMKKEDMNLSTRLSHTIGSTKIRERNPRSSRYTGNSEADLQSTYFNSYTIEVSTKLSKNNLLPGNFTVDNRAHSVLKGLEKFGEKFASESKKEEIRKTRTTDVIMLNDAGKIYYVNIPKLIWDRFVQTGALEYIEALLKLWQETAYMGLTYSEGKLLLEIQECCEPKIRYEGYQCFENDMLITNAEQFTKTLQLLHNVGNCIAM